MNPQIFREYDVRGLVDQDLNEETVELLGRGYGTYIQSFGYRQALVGRDNRPSSLVYREALTRGLVSTGVDVIDVGELPTPAFYFSLVEYSKQAGAMITGSHNPPQYNGFKLCRGHGTVYGDEIQKLRRIIEDGRFASGEGKVSEADPLPAYTDHIASGINVERPLKVVVDAGNGVGGKVAPGLLRRLGCEVVELYCDLDGNFPNHFPDPTVPENLEDLIATVAREKADLGIALDGDADRIGAVADNGDIVWGDQLMILFARDILEFNPGGTIIFEVKCSQALVEDIRAHGGNPLMWKTGHSLIEAKIREEKALLAGEMSGHIYFADRYFGFDDAIYSACRLVEFVARKGEKLSQIMSDFPRYYATPELRIESSEDEKFKIVEALKEDFAGQEVIDIDGVRVVFPDGWGLVRASNTSPVVVVRAEAKTPERRDEIRELILSKLKRFPSVTAHI
ncbi:MAG: phosphomannomutase/phosphoglucomutase [Thermoleophilia bacterium]|nr:phosphomannomutase/phosphoglucomutase [Thermoleophilia bacterium]